ncbi:MAG: hypothetical protein COA43_08925 [Robiginitomaculum sp.]|nr:MAG: hypothetical protein COA43_08925 [Robiginitomaculum sp.]
MDDKSLTKNNADKIKIKLSWKRWFTIPILLIFLINVGFTTIPNYLRLKEDPRNNTATMVTYQRWGVMPNQLVIDLWGLNETASKIDVTRMVFHVAEKMKGRNFDWVVLSYRGQSRLKIEGNFFSEIGNSLDQQNPVYLMRTLPSQVYSMDGNPAYETWSGGLIAVLGQQMDDLNELHDDWYLDDMK